jgi:hypothetical protein
MTPEQKNYFDNMVPGQRLSTKEVRDPSTLIAAGKEYIDQGGFAYFSDDYSSFTKEAPYRCPRSITILIDGIQH